MKQLEDVRVLQRKFTSIAILSIIALRIMSSWEELTSECYASHTGTPFYIIIIGLMTSLFIDCYMFFAGQTLATRCWMYTKQFICCCCCCRKKYSNPSSPRASKPSSPLIIQIACTNTKDGRILDVCGYYKRYKQAPDGTYLYRSTFNSYIDQSVLVLHYSAPPDIIKSNRNTTLFSDGSSASIHKPRWMISAIDTSVIPIDSLTMTEDGSDGDHQTGSHSKGLSTSTTFTHSDGTILEFQQIPVIAIQSPINDLSQSTLQLQGIQSTSTLLQSPIQILLDEDREWVFEDQPSGQSVSLNISGGTVSHYVMNWIAFLMVILAIYQLFIDGVALWKYIKLEHEFDLSFYDYQCYAVIVTNSPSFKQIFIILGCLMVGKMNAVIFVKHLSVFRKLLGAVYMVYPVLCIPVLMTHTAPFLMLYFGPILFIIGCVVWQWEKIKDFERVMRSGQKTDEDRTREEFLILVLGFTFIFAFYILSILSVSTMVRVYDGDGYGQSLLDALSERQSDDYLQRKFQGLYNLEEIIEVLYRMI